MQWCEYWKKSSEEAVTVTEEVHPHPYKALKPPSPLQGWPPEIKWFFTVPKSRQHYLAHYRSSSVIQSGRLIWRSSSSPPPLEVGGLSPSSSWKFEVSLPAPDINVFSTADASHQLPTLTSLLVSQPKSFAMLRVPLLTLACVGAGIWYDENDDMTIGPHGQVKMWWQNDELENHYMNIW